MILLALDTCDSRGSLAILRGDSLLDTIVHEGTADYSSWVLLSAHQALRAAGLEMRDVEVFAAASGPGSFTGVRMGLTTVKAWSEAYGKPIASMSRLEAMASLSVSGGKYVAAFVDAHREQVFGGLYRRQEGVLARIEEEMVAAPDGFVRWVGERTVGDVVSWISMDPEKLTASESWRKRAQSGEVVEVSTNVLAPAIARLGRQRALRGRLTDALALDAEYVRRTDAELLLKTGAKLGS